MSKILVKKIFTTLVILFFIGVSAIVTKPSDTKCIELMKSKLESKIADGSRSKLLNSLCVFFTSKAINKVKGLLRFEDKIFYKNIYLIPGNVKVGTALFGMFIPSRGFKEKFE